MIGAGLTLVVGIGLATGVLAALWARFVSPAPREKAWDGPDEAEDLRTW